MTRIDYDQVTGAPSWIASTIGFLSGPTNEQEITPKMAQSPLPSETDAPHGPIKRFLDENRALFGHGAEVLSTAIIVRDYVTAHNGMRTVIWQQQLDGIPVFAATVIGNITRRGELVSVSSHFLPDIAKSSGLEPTQRSELESAPPISARQAVANALTNIGENITVDAVTTNSSVSTGPGKQQAFAADTLFGGARVSLVWLPMSRTSVRLCWLIYMSKRSSLEVFRTLVDAFSGEVLVQQNLTCSYADATYRVYTSDSPAPGTPGLQVPGSNQGINLNTPEVECVDPQLISMPALSALASPQGWIRDYDNLTLGNNVDTSLNRVAKIPNPTPRPQGAPFRVFDFIPDLDADPSSYGDAAVVTDQSAA